MIRRMLLLMVLTGAVAATNLGTDAPHETSDLVQGAVAQEKLVDLAWLAPEPADLDEEGYSLLYGVYHPVVEGRVSIVGLPGLLTPYDEAYGSTGARQIYFQSMSLPSEDEPDVAARLVSVVIGEFGNDDGATSGFAAVADVLGEEYTQSQTPPDVGDEALAFRGEFTDADDGDIYQELRIVFRTGRFLAGVIIADYVDDTPVITELMPIAELLAERLEDVEATESPRLALQVIRITSPDLTTFYDYYTRRGGEQVRRPGQLTTGMQAEDEYFEAMGVTDLYEYTGEVQRTGDEEAFVSQIGGAYLFTDRRMAETFLKTAVDHWIEDWSADYQDIEIVDDAEEVGDDLAVVSYTMQTPFGEAKGSRSWIRAGNRVAVVDVVGVPAITLPAAQKLVEAQLACFDDGTCVEPIPMSEWGQAEAEATPAT